MLVKSVTLTNFRNYKSQEVAFSPERNIIIGDNAQGKTNLLEAIEFVTCGKSYRTSSDGELILAGSGRALVEVEYTIGNYDEKVSILISTKAASGKTNRIATEKQIKINGVLKGNSRSLRGHLVTVAFTSRDLDLLRGGPAHRRDWIDSLAGTLKRTFEPTLSRYHKTVAQRNRLLKAIFDKSGRFSSTDQDQLKVWDQQVAALGAQVIKQRVEALARALPIAERYQSRMSGASEKLTAEYFFYVSSSENAYGSQYDDGDFGSRRETPRGISHAELLAMEEREIASRLMNFFRLRRRDEIARRQTLSGPHRDDVRFALNGACATAYASQGQQRSLVLSLKLAELELTKEHIGEPPVLLLDDVMAELDLNRQGFLVASVESGMQTLITTTHTTGFKREWLEGATYISVANGHATLLSSVPTQESSFNK